MHTSEEDLLISLMRMHKSLIKELGEGLKGHLNDYLGGIVFLGSMIPDWLIHCKEASNYRSCEIDIDGLLYWGEIIGIAVYAALGPIFAISSETLLHHLLKDLGVCLSTPHTPWCNNSGTTYLSVNPVMHAHTKHIELDYHFVRECVAAKMLQVSFVSSKDQLADILTKPLSISRFTQLQLSLTICQVPLGSRGAVKKRNEAVATSTPDNTTAANVSTAALTQGSTNMPDRDKNRAIPCK